ncbi:MAG: ABC transporter substrate-binding protein [Thermodesulfobacteriota bacterium]
MSWRKMLFVSLALFLLIPAAAQAGDPGVTDTEIVIGVSTPLTGPAALWGTTALGLKAWADYINDSGGINGRKLNVIIKDDGYNPTKSVANLQEMKAEVFAIAALLGSAPCNASKDFFPENQIPLILPYANVRIYGDQPPEKRHWYFQAYPDYEDEAAYLTNYALENLGTKTIALFYQNDDFGNMAKSGVEKALAASGGKAKLAAAVPFEVTERALGTHALKMKESGADTVIIYATPSHTAGIVKEMAKVAYKPTMLTNFTVADPILYKLAGEAWEGMYVAMPGQISMPGFDPEADKVIEKLLKYNPELKGKEYLAEFGAVTMMHLAKGLENAGKDLTREGLIKGMEMIKDWKPEGVGAPTTYAPDRHHGLNASRMCRAEGGQHKPIGDWVIYEPKY